ncbi:MAG TPA: TonB family protein [Thermoanaerobaculia bacterium]|nr:TonB family protein [Thermoanaerobaculia bacterium]
MSLLLGAVLLASNLLENPRFVSPNGEMVVVVRYDEAEAEMLPDLVLLPDEPRPQPKPVRAALYHEWAGGYREPISEFEFQRAEGLEDVLVADDGHIVTHRLMQCGAADALLTIRDARGKEVRTLRALDLMTKNDQQWFCRGAADEIRYSIDGATLRVTMVVPERDRTVDIELATGAAPAPDRDHCPPVSRIVAEGEEALLNRAVGRVIPEYPEIAMRARISGVVGVQVEVGRDGKVESATIIKPLPFGLDKAVHDAIVKWDFMPAAERVAGVLWFRFEILRSWPIGKNH